MAISSFQDQSNALCIHSNRLNAESLHARCEHAEHHQGTDSACWLMAASRSTAGRTLAALERLRTTPPHTVPQAHAQCLAFLRTRQGR